MSGKADVLHDAASLYRFIESIELFCDIRPDFPAYLDASKDFLNFIKALAKSTKRYLLDFPAKIPTDAARYPLFRQELTTLRYAWFEIHRRIKPIWDADTLHVPTSLISGLERRLRRVLAFNRVRFAVLHTERLNYLQVVASGIRDTTSSISTLVGSPPLLPEIGLIGIPYSQAESVFTNCLIAHEIGHFVFGELQLKNSLAPKISSALTAAFTPAANQLTPQDGLRIPSVVSGWVEELFCDIFAVSLIGPCYSYAFIELFDLTNNFNQDGTPNLGASAPAMEFSDSHPADMYRIQNHVRTLSRLGWWDLIKGSDSLCRKLLQHCSSLNPTGFSFPSHAICRSFSSMQLKGLYLKSRRLRKVR